MSYFLKCISCENKYAPNKIIYRCECGDLLDVWHDKLKIKKQKLKMLFDIRLKETKLPLKSGVWRYKELVLPIDKDYIVSKPEGNTNLYQSQKLSDWVGVKNLYIKHEGENPTGSFKDRGMTVGVSVAKKLGIKSVACASTGNTSSSLASYAATAGLGCLVFIPEGKISLGKLSQSIAYGAKNLQIKGDFDTAMNLVQKVSKKFNIYLLNSINPYRIEGQKSIIFEMLHQLNWQIPDWIVLPGGNLGNTAAFGKALYELKNAGLIKNYPRLAVIQAKGANPFYQSFKTGFENHIKVKADTIASAIKIGNPVSYKKAIRSLKWTNGVVEEVTDTQILDAKAKIDKAGIGCEPASATSVAGLKKLKESKVIKEKQTVVCVLTGHLLKDTKTTLSYHLEKLPKIHAKFANPIVSLEPTVEAVKVYIS